jgi:hypothetical protein
MVSTFTSTLIYLFTFECICNAVCSLSIGKIEGSDGELELAFSVRGIVYHLQKMLSRFSFPFAFCIALRWVAAESWWQGTKTQENPHMRAILVAGAARADMMGVVNEP